MYIDVVLVIHEGSKKGVLNKKVEVVMLNWKHEIEMIALGLERISGYTKYLDSLIVSRT